MRLRCQRLAFAILALVGCGQCFAEHDLEYVAEHLPEVAMDNRFATLPVWGDASSGYASEEAGWGGVVQAAASTIKVGTLSLDGPLFSASLRHELGRSWHVGVFGFYDDLTFKSGSESRPLQTLFAPQTPIERPVQALFTDLDGKGKDIGGGFYFSRVSEGGWLGRHGWVGGVLWQRVELTDYRFNYEITEGPQRGLTGQIDFDADYDHVTPFIGIEVPRQFGQWTIALHGLLAVPLPVRGVAGHITGPGFDLSGDSASAGNGKHFGDPSLTLGLNFTYRPARLTVDLGAALTQAFLEPMIHPGIDRNVLLSISWSW